MDLANNWGSLVVYIGKSPDFERNPVIFASGCWCVNFQNILENWI